MKLTETIVRNLPTPKKPTLSSDDLTANLYLKISAAGTKAFVYRARRGKQWEVVTLGRFPAMSLAAARKKANDLNDRKEGSASLTFGELLDEWFSARIEPRYKVTKNIETYVARGKDTLGNKQLAALTTRELVAELQRYAAVSPVSANRCLSNWKLALDYAVECGHLEHNPLARTTARAVGGEEKSRERTLTDDEIRQLWVWQGRNASLLRFLLCTGLRISEGQQGRQDGALWRCDSTKNGKAHWVSLPPLALEQIEPWEHSPTAVQSWLKRKGVDFTPHDLRRTFATRLNGIGIEPHIVEKCLNHSMQGVMATYNRFDYAEQRIAAASAWETELKRIIADT